MERRRCRRAVSARKLFYSLENHTTKMGILSRVRIRNRVARQKQNAARFRLCAVYVISPRKMVIANRSLGARATDIGDRPCTARITIVIIVVLLYYNRRTNRLPDTIMEFSTWAVHGSTVRAEAAERSVGGKNDPDGRRERVEFDFPFRLHRHLVDVTRP